MSPQEVDKETKRIRQQLIALSKVSPVPLPVYVCELVHLRVPALVPVIVSVSEPVLVPVLVPVSVTVAVTVSVSVSVPMPMRRSAGGSVCVRAYAAQTPGSPPVSRSGSTTDLSSPLLNDPEGIKGETETARLPFQPQLPRFVYVKAVIVPITSSLTDCLTGTAKRKDRDAAQTHTYISLRAPHYSTALGLEILAPKVPEEVAKEFFEFSLEKSASRERTREEIIADLKKFKENVRPLTARPCMGTHTHT